jgi:NAD(P)-dependent dehydrogenase (short-subunit alcohol dehydrogenase family)
MPLAKRLDGKIALVTGAARGIGQAIARRFIEEGACVALCDIDAAAGLQSAEVLGDAAHFITLDVSSEQSFAAAITATLKRWNRLDILVNNAGIVLPVKPIQSTSTDEYARLMIVNIGGTFFGCKLAYPHLCRTHGCVLNISSIVGVVGEKNHALYGATKGAINALTICTAADWRHDKIRINALCPGDVWTDAMDQWCRQTRGETHARYQHLRRAGLCAEPVEIAAIAAFLCSDEARFINGAIIPATFAAERGYSL